MMIAWNALPTVVACILLLSSCATKKTSHASADKPQPNPPSFILEFVTSDANWALPAQCKKELGNSVTLVGTLDEAHCASKMATARAVFFNCDGSTETKVVDGLNQSKKFYKNLNSCLPWMLDAGYVIVDSLPPSVRIAIDGKIMGRAPMIDPIKKPSDRVKPLKFSKKKPIEVYSIRRSITLKTPAPRPRTLPVRRPDWRRISCLVRFLLYK